MQGTWDRTTFDADGLTGERLGITLGGNRYTVVVWPGRATRLFWTGGHHVDFHGRDGRSRAIQTAEEMGKRG